MQNPLYGHHENLTYNSSSQSRALRTPSQFDWIGNAVVPEKGIRVLRIIHWMFANGGAVQRCCRGCPEAFPMSRVSEINVTYYYLRPTLALRFIYSYSSSSEWNTILSVLEQTIQTKNIEIVLEILPAIEKNNRFYLYNFLSSDSREAAKSV